MRQIEQLIEKYCPNGVEKETLENVFLLRNGYTPSKANSEFWDKGTIPWYRMEDIRDKGRILSDSYLHITEAAIKGKGLFKANSFILATTATIGEHALLIADSLANQRFTNLQIRESLKERIDVKFMYYYMFVVDDFCKNHTNKSGFSSVDMTELKRMLIPLPSLEIQKCIVEDLDKFAGIVDNLETELNLRRKQFEHYREKLLAFGEDVEWTELGKVVEIHGRIGWQGLTKKDYRNSGNYMLVTGTDFLSTNRICYDTCVYVDEDRYTQDENIQLRENDLLITKDGTIGKLAIVQDLPMPATLNGGVFVIRDKSNTLIHKFLMYIMASSNFKAQIEKMHTNGTIKHLTQNLLVKYRIPVPPLATQQSIVSTLDKFTALIENIEKELALRQKQYEYYREQLLNF